MIVALAKSPWPRAAGGYRALLGACLLALCATSAPAGAEDRDRPRTATPIKHLIVLFGENRSFDHVFGTYKPRHGQRIDNLLSRGIVDENGRPGQKFARAAQFKVLPQARYFIGAPDNAKGAYQTLPPPDLHGVPQQGSDANPPPFATVAAAQAAEPSLKPADAVLLTTGASMLPQNSGPDTRIANVTALPNGPFQLTARDPRNGQGLSYDAYTQDTIHRFFQMWQQSDCAVRHGSSRRRPTRRPSREADRRWRSST
jgi:phospholipase C